MNATSKLSEVKQTLKEQGCQAMMIENCGMPDEKIYRSTDEIPEKGSYYSLTVIKNRK